jgi:hypothetical protein
MQINPENTRQVHTVRSLLILLGMMGIDQKHLPRCGIALDFFAWLYV